MNHVPLADDRSAGLADRVALVTGGGRGIGRLVAQALAAHGVAVGLIARSPDELAETVELVERAGGIAAAAPADVTDQAGLAVAVEHVRATLGSPDILINNAGVLGPIGPSWEVDGADWWRTMEVNVRGVMAAANLVLPDMIARGSGRILNITSQAGVYRWPIVSGYSVSKAAVVKLSENLAHETGRYGVQVFSVHPGLLPIGLAESAFDPEPAAGSYEGRILQWVQGELDAGRGAEPAEAVDLIVRIAAGHADVLSGRHLSVHDDLDALVARISEVRADDLYLLHPRRLAAVGALRPAS
jgi:NAD(P)-dependent dehydrogenase (short-subunit alcohol dehydrogenase family)